MNQVPKRSETAPEHRWKLSDLFEDQAAWDEEYAAAKKQMKEVSAFEGKLADSVQLKACFELEDELSLHVERLYVYANMKHHEDTAEPEFQALSDKSKKLSVETGEALSFITPEVLSLSDEELEALINKQELAKFRHTLEEMRRQKAHILSKAEEALLAQVGNISQAPGTIFSMLNNADLKFPKVKDEHGEEIELTQGRYIQFLESKDREVRKAAFKAMYETYGKLKNTIAATLSANVTKNVFYANARKYPSTLEMSLYRRQYSERRVYKPNQYDSQISAAHAPLHGACGRSC